MLLGRSLAPREHLAQFRPADAAPVTDPKDEAREQRMSDANNRNWQAFCREFPITGPIRRRMAEYAATMAREHESSIAFAEAQSAYLLAESQLGEKGRFSADR